MLPRGLRNKNPGNIVRSTLPFPGKVAGDDPRFECFATYLDGERANALLLLRYRAQGLNTIAGAIAKWAPPSENDTVAYIAKVAKDIGVGPTTPVDFSDPQILRALVVAIGRFENGATAFDAEIGADVLDNAVAQALGIAPASVTAETPPNRPTVTPIVPISAPFVSPTKEPTMPLLAALIPMILQVFAPLAQQKISQELNRHTDNPAVGTAVAQNLMDVVLTATKTVPDLAAAATATDAQKVQAVATLQQMHADDPASITPIEQTALATLEQTVRALQPLVAQLGELDEKRWAADRAGKNDASTRSLAEKAAGLWDMTRTLVVWSELQATMVLIGGFGVVIWLLYLGKVETAFAAMTGVSAWVTMILRRGGQAYDYRFDGTHESAAQTAALSQLPSQVR